MEIFVKDFSGTTGPRILKFGTNMMYDRLYCVLKNQPYMAYQFLLFVHFSFFPTFFPSYQLSIYKCQSSNFIYTMRTTKCITVNKTKVQRFIFAFFFYFFFFLSLNPMQ